jgi:type I restriction enzyme S subunit
LNWRFLYHLISHQKLVNLDRSTAIPGLSRDDYNKVRVQVAPLGEQDRIVDEIEKQFTRLDAATAALKRVQANLKRYRASVLKAACEGRLVPTEAELARKEGRDYEPADKLLQRILRERRARWEADTLAKMIAAGKRPTDDRWKQKYKEPPAPDTSNHPALPDGWVCVSLDAVADVIDPNPSHRTPRYVEHGVAFVSAENFVGDSGVDFKIGRQVGQEVLKEQIERFPILPGAFAMSRYGTIGKTCKLPPERTYCLSYSLVVIQSASALVDSDFLRLVCSSGMIMGLAQSRIQGAAIPDLGVANIRSLPIALPSREEQMRINEEAARKLSVVDQMTESISHLLVHADRLRQSVLTSAFTGQLVPQDPTDEPASALLERIRAGRVESSKKTAARNVARKRGKQ